MTDTSMTHDAPYSQLPDPELDAAFYEGVLSKRLVAWFIDLGAILAISLPILVLVGVVTLGFGLFAAPFLITLIAFAYRVVTIADRSATWGMRVMGIELRLHSGRKFDLFNAFLHTLLFFALMASVLGWVASILAMLMTARGQGLGDLLLGTTAINKPVE